MATPHFSLICSKILDWPDDKSLNLASEQGDGAFSLQGAVKPVLTRTFTCAIAKPQQRLE